MTYDAKELKERYADVLEKIAREQYSDPSSDNLTVPLAIRLAEVSDISWDMLQALIALISKLEECGYNSKEVEDAKAVISRARNISID